MSVQNKKLMFFPKKLVIENVRDHIDDCFIFLRQSNCFATFIQKYRIFSQKKLSYHFELRLDRNQNSWGEVLNDHSFRFFWKFESGESSEIFLNIILSHDPKSQHLLTFGQHLWIIGHNTCAESRFFVSS